MTTPAPPNDASPRNRRPTVVGLGEVLWDDLPNGRRLGGAPANVAYHAMLRGADAKLITAVGTDEPGRTALDRLTNQGIDVNHVAELSDRPTGVVDVTLDDAGSATYDIRTDVAWDHIPLTDANRNLARSADAICFGTLAQRNDVSRRTIMTLLDAAGPDCLRVYDVNLRAPHFSAEIIRASVERCDVLKLNDDEVPDAAAALGVASDEPVFASALIGLGLRMVVVTRGGDGSVLYTPDDVSELEPEPVEVVDTVGAGDSFTAAVLMGLLADEDLSRIHRKAAAVASYVCTQEGATPETPEDVLAGK
ncbi:MAG: carbohydrate kinase [Planctomycetota bacterium]